MNTSNTVILAVAILVVGGVIAWALTRSPAQPMAAIAQAPVAAPAAPRAPRRSGVERGIETLTALAAAGSQIATSIQGSSPSGLGGAAGGK